MRTGRPRKDGELSPSYQRKLPKKMTEKDKSMQADYLIGKPIEEIAEKYGIAKSTVEIRKTCFGWVAAKKQLDAERKQPHRRIYKDAFEFGHTGIFALAIYEISGHQILKGIPISEKNLSALEPLGMRSMVEDMIKNPSQITLTVKNPKDLLVLWDVVKKVYIGFEEDTPATPQDPKGINIYGDNAKILQIDNPYAQPVNQSQNERAEGAEQKLKEISDE